MVAVGNFLTIALGAGLLPDIKQGKLIYTYPLYIAPVSFNTAVFSSADIIRNETKDTDFYRKNSVN